jgi:hypothetical protein
MKNKITTPRPNPIVASVPTTAAASNTVVVSDCTLVIKILYNIHYIVTLQLYFPHEFYADCGTPIPIVLYTFVILL